MRLYIYLLQGSVVCVHSTLGTMQIVAPFHTGLENGQELTVGYMVSSLSGSQLLAEERHRALLLQQLSTQTHYRCITMHLEWLAEVRQLQHRC